MAIATTEYTLFNDLKASGVTTTDTFNTWRKKTNGLIVLLDGTVVGGGLLSSNLSAGAPSWTSGGETSIFGGTAVTTGNALTIVAGAGSTNGLIITQTGPGAALRVNDVTGDTTPLIVDENGHLIVGSAYALSFNNRAAASITSVVPHIAAIGAGAANGASVSIFQTANDAYSGVLSFVKSRGTASSSAQTALVTGDSLGIIDWQGQGNATTILTAAAIEAKTTGTISGTSMPGYLTFSTNAANSLSERMRIDSAGNVGIGTATPSVALDVSGAIRATGNISTTSGTISNGTVTITGSAITGLASYSVTGDITAATGKLKGATLDVGSSAQLTVNNTGALSTSGAITGGAITGTSLSAGSGNITTTGSIKSNGITINGNQINAGPAQTLALAAASADGTTTTAYNTIIYDGRGAAVVTVIGGSKAVTFAGALSGITTLGATSAVTAGSLSSSGGLAAGGAITGATTIAATGAITSTGGAITGVGLAAGTGTITTSATITATGAITSTGGAITGVGLAAGTGTITGASLNVGGAIGGTSCAITGAVTGQSFVVTAGGSGAITTAGIVTGSGGLVSGAGVAAGGAITGATTIGATGAITSGANSTGAGGLITSTRDTQNGYNSAALISQSYVGDAGLSLLAQGSCAVFLKCERTTGTLHIHTHAFSPATTYANVILNQLDAKGDIIAFSTSDRKYKDNIANITNPLDKVAQINGVTFDWNDKQSTFTGRDVGVIAQEVEAVLPEVVTTRDDGTKAVKYDKMVALLIECVKELKAEIEELKSKVN